MITERRYLGYGLSELYIAYTVEGRCFFDAYRYECWNWERPDVNPEVITQLKLDMIRHVDKILSEV